MDQQQAPATAAAGDAAAVAELTGGGTIPALLNTGAERTESKVTPSTLGMAEPAEQRRSHHAAATSTVLDEAPLLTEVRDTINSLLSSDLVVVAAALDVIQILCRTDETRAARKRTKSRKNVVYSMSIAVMMYAITVAGTCVRCCSEGG